MTADEQISEVRNSVSKLESGIATDVRRIFERLEQLSNDRSVSEERLQSTIRAHDTTMIRVGKQEIKILEIERYMITEVHRFERTKAWLVGLWSGVAFFASIFGAIIAIAVNIIVSKL